MRIHPMTTLLLVLALLAPAAVPAAAAFAPAPAPVAVAVGTSAVTTPATTQTTTDEPTLDSVFPDAQLSSHTDSAIGGGIVIKQPTATDEPYSAGAMVEVVFEVPLVDLQLTDALYRVEVSRDGQTTFQTSVYSCKVLAQGRGECTTTVKMPDTQGLATVTVLATFGTQALGTSAILSTAECSALQAAYSLCDSVPVVVGGYAKPTLRVSLFNSPQTFVPNGASVQLVYQVSWIGGEELGNPAGGEEVRLFAIANGAETPVRNASTDLSGIVSFTLNDYANSDIDFVARAINPEVDKLDSAPLNVIWTNLDVERTKTADMPRTNGYANTAEIYRVAYTVTFTYSHGPAPSATVTIVDSDSKPSRGITGEDGIAAVPVRENEPATVAFTASATFDPANGPAQSVDADGSTTIVWARVVFDQLTEDGTLLAGSTDPTLGWHDVTDGVTFGFLASYDFGTGVKVPVENAVIALTFDDATAPTATTDANGAASIKQAFNKVTVVTPKLSVVKTGLEINASVAADFGTQRWTEIVLTATPQKTTTHADPEFVDVNTAITYDLVATYAHDEAPAAGVSVDVIASDSAILLESGCQPGTPCAVTSPTTYDGKLTFVITASDTGVTRQFENKNLFREPVWTQIVLSACSYDDDFVNVGDVVTRSCTASYDHNAKMKVDQATLTLDNAPAACALAKNKAGAARGTIAKGGVVDLAIVCHDVVDASDAAIAFVVADSNTGVTTVKAADGATFDPIFNAIWTKVHVAYTTDVLPGTVLEPGAPVKFTATVTFAHGGAVNEAAVVVKSTDAGDQDEFVCLTDSQGMCVIEVVKDLGEFEFTVEGFSTTNEGGFLTPDVTSMANVPAPSTFRWTEIAFLDFVCTGATTSGACNATVFQRGELVTVTATAVAADTGELLKGIRVTLAGQEFTTDDDGKFSRSFTRFTAGSITVAARGVEWDLGAAYGGQKVTWTETHKETISFE